MVDGRVTELSNGALNGPTLSSLLINMINVQKRFIVDKIFHRSILIVSIYRRTSFILFRGYMFMFQLIKIQKLKEFSISSIYFKKKNQTKNEQLFTPKQHVDLKINSFSFILRLVVVVTLFACLDNDTELFLLSTKSDS